MTLGIQGQPEIGVSQLGDIAQKQIHNRWDTFDEVELEMTMKGFPPLDKPGFAPPVIDHHLYSALSGSDSKQITYKNMQFCAWYGFSLQTEVRESARVRQIQNEMENLRSRLHTQLTSAGGAKKATKEMIERQAHADPRYLELMVALQMAEHAHDVAAAYVKYYATGKALTSRTVEIRRQDLESAIGNSGARRYPDEGM